MHFLGLWGMPRRTYRYDSGLGWETLNKVVTVGAFTIAFSVLVFIVNAVVSKARGEIAGNDPWDARTLEWATSSPPPEYNFAEIPEVHSRDDFWYQKYTEDDEGRLVPLPSGGADAAVHAPHDGHGIHMPAPSYFPFVTALGLPIMGYGAVYHNVWAGIAGAIVLLFGMYAWAIEPAD
jgi:cytochrome c oxidase subunit 1